MAGQKSSKSKKKGEDDKSVKSKSKSKEKSPSKAEKKQKEPKQSKSKKQSGKEKSKKTQPVGQPVGQQSIISEILPPIPADCVHHKSPFIYYCQTCQQLVCNQCTVYGPHNNHLHRILKIQDVYRSRVFYLSEAIRSNLVDKRDKIIAQLHRLEYRIEEIRFVKGIIERDIRSEYSGILERLKGFEGIKLAKLSHQVSLLQRQIDTINDLGNQFFTLTSMDCDQNQQQKRVSKFLLKSKQMYEAIQYLINKPEREIPDLQLDKIPKQIQTNREDLQKALASKQLNIFKNQLIWKLNIQLNNHENFVDKQISVKSQQCLNEFSSILDMQCKKLMAFNMTCYYCGLKSTPESLKHNVCQKNMQGVEPYRKNTQKTPSHNFNYNGRHFFSYQLSQNIQSP